MKTLKDLKECFEFAIENKYNYVAVLVCNMESDSAEIIINHSKNFESKLEYYKSAYNDDLTLKTFPKIKIVSFVYADTFDEIEYVLLNR